MQIAQSDMASFPYEIQIALYAYLMYLWYRFHSILFSSVSSFLHLNCKLSEDCFPFIFVLPTPYSFMFYVLWICNEVSK